MRGCPAVFGYATALTSTRPSGKSAALSLTQYSQTLVWGLSDIWVTLTVGPLFAWNSTRSIPLMWNATTPRLMDVVTVCRGTASQCAMTRASYPGIPGEPTGGGWGTVDSGLL